MIINQSFNQLLINCNTTKSKRKRNQLIKLDSAEKLCPIIELVISKFIYLILYNYHF